MSASELASMELCEILLPSDVLNWLEGWNQGGDADANEPKLPILCS